MGFLKNFLQGFTVKDNTPEVNMMTEEEILQAIDQLPDNKVDAPVPNHWPINDTYTKVDKPHCWTEFKYLGKPNFKGLPNIETDNRVYFTIPCGFEWDQSLKFWFLTFPANCYDDEIKEFFTAVNPSEV